MAMATDGIRGIIERGKWKVRHQAIAGRNRSNATLMVFDYTGLADADSCIAVPIPRPN